MDIGIQMVRMRKARGLSQEQLAETVKTSREMADKFEVTLDFLVSEDAQPSVIDKQTLKRLEDIQNLPEADRESLLLTIDNFIKATKLKAIQ